MLKWIRKQLQCCTLVIKKFYFLGCKTLSQSYGSSSPEQNAAADVQSPNSVFWTQIFDALKEVFKVNIPLSPTVAALGRNLLTAKPTLIC